MGQRHARGRTSERRRPGAWASGGCRRLIAGRHAARGPPLLLDPLPTPTHPPRQRCAGGLPHCGQTSTHCVFSPAVCYPPPNSSG